MQLSNAAVSWVEEIGRGREGLQDDAQSGRPSSSISPENIDIVHKLVVENRSISPGVRRSNRPFIRIHA